KLYGILRDSRGVPCWMIATGNPGGVGHNWVKAEFIDAAPPFTPFAARDEDDKPLLNPDGSPVQRVFIPAKVWDNQILLDSDPGYVSRLQRQAKHLAKAWIDGDWNVVPGAFLEDVFDPARHLVRLNTHRFPFTAEQGPPYWWKRWKGIDWGSRRPYSIGWYTQNPEGQVIRYRERYGWSGKPNLGTREDAPRVAEIIKHAERMEPPTSRRAMSVGDASMWNEAGHEKGVSIASIMRQHGAIFFQGPQSPHSRTSLAQVLVAALREDNLLIAENCRHWIRTVPVLQPDPDHFEDVDTDGEDHAWDETRYALWAWQSRGSPGEKPKDARPAPRSRPKLQYDPDTGKMLPVNPPRTGQDLLNGVR
ncbi:MAG: hypothetical protein OXC11_07840, partial [Rhodospirillales bacterium]|nr:hypothetical protein [Rhodospirillales bacterium]